MQRDPEGTETGVILDLLGPGAGDVLEIGCGDGRLTAGLAEAADRLTGIDVDRGSIDQARSLMKSGLTLVLGSGEDAPFTDGAFDTVVYSLSLHHLDSSRSLSEARRLLRSRGRILVLEPVEHSLMTMLFALIEDETVQYEKAETAVRTSGLREERSRAVRTRWVFEDFAEMTGYIFAYFGREADREIERAMADLLGGRRTQRPLSVEDKTRCWLLREGPG